MPNDSPSPRLSPTAIYADLRDKICLLEIPPGTVLRESELAVHYGVSRTPLREAIQRVATLGLVESRNGVGTIVTEPDPTLILQAYEMRLKVAELIGAMTPNPIDEKHLTEMELYLAQAKDLTKRFDITAYFAINHGVHFLIGRIIGNHALREMWDRLYFQTARAWYTTASGLGSHVAEDHVRELESTLDAMRRGDPTAIGYIQRNHIAYAIRHVASE